MSIFQPFDATTIDPTQGGGQFPVGRHPVVAISQEIKATSSNDGGMLVFVLRAIDGPAKDSEGVYRLNLYNSNPKAVEIAFKQLSALCHVTGKFRITDPSELLNIPFVIDVQLQKGENPNGYTEVRKVFDMHGNEPGKAPTHSPQPAGQPAQPAAALAWAGQPGAPVQQQAPAPVQQQAPAWAGQPAATQPAPVQQAAPAGVAPWGQR
jgi:hypothetical protein